MSRERCTFRPPFANLTGSLRFSIFRFSTIPGTLISAWTGKYRSQNFGYPAGSISPPPPPPQLEPGKPEMRPSSHQAVGKWTSRTLFFQSNGIKCSEGRVESPAMWVFALPWDVWSCEFTSGASEVGVGRQALAWYRRKSFAGGLQPITQFFFFAMYLADFTVCRTGLRVKLYGFPLIPTHSSTIHSRQSEGRHSTVTGHFKVYHPRSSAK